METMDRAKGGAFGLSIRLTRQMSNSSRLSSACRSTSLLVCESGRWMTQISRTVLRRRPGGARAGLRGEGPWGRFGPPATRSLQRRGIMNANKTLWEKGDFTRIAESMRESGESLVKDLGVTEGLQVLDLGCGDGTTALPTAQLGADVLGVDIASNLVAAGNARAQALGLTNCKFQEGDATDLHELADQSFDLVISIFGAMFAPRPFDVAKEMVRVTRPGGRIVMGNWIPNDPTLVAQILRISSTYSPPPPEGFVSPMTWGVEDDVVERFTAAGIPEDQISFQRDTYTFHFPDPPARGGDLASEATMGPP